MIIVLAPKSVLRVVVVVSVVLVVEVLVVVSVVVGVRPWWVPPPSFPRPCMLIYLLLH